MRSIVALTVFLLCLLLPASAQQQEVVCDEANGFCENKERVHIVDPKLPKGANERGLPPTITPECQDRTDRCIEYAGQGECDNNPGWMTINCPISCNACHLLDPKVRCDRNHLNISSEPIYKPGDMQAMFESIYDNFHERFGVEIASRDPWVVVFNNFIDDEEAAAIIDTVSDGWERSTDTGATNEYGETGRVLSTTRTSSNAWCRHDCENHPLVQRVMSKIEEVTRIPRSHYESFQVLNYDVGQRYAVHHDMAPSQSRFPSGPRILTFFLYLSDVEEGGETAFPKLDIAVRPRKGQAVLWPSTMNEYPDVQDPRTTHEARPVIEGQKLAANSWIHLYDFQRSNLWGCTGTFDML